MILVWCQNNYILELHFALLDVFIKIHLPNFVSRTQSKLTKFLFVKSSCDSKNQQENTGLGSFQKNRNSKLES